MTCDQNQDTGKWEVRDEDGRVIGEAWFEDSAMLAALRSIRDENEDRAALAASVGVEGMFS